MITGLTIILDWLQNVKSYYEQYIEALEIDILWGRQGAEIILTRPYVKLEFGFGYWSITLHIPVQVNFNQHKWLEMISSQQDNLTQSNHLS